MIQGTNDGEPGSRLPALWSMGSSEDKMDIMILYGSDSTYDFMPFIPEEKLNTGDWINLKISQINATYQIEIDHKLAYAYSYYPNPQINTHPIRWTNVEVVTGLYLPVNGSYRNFEIYNFIGPNIKKTPVAENKILCPEWKLSFDVYLEDQPDFVTSLIGFSGSSRLPTMHVKTVAKKLMLTVDYMPVSKNTTEKSYSSLNGSLESSA